jgi:4'-phosphopantetheinyl transferase
MSSVSSWHSPPQIIPLRSDEVHVWRAELDLRAPWVQRLQQTLSTDELAKMRRFYLQKDRERFIVGRGLLRTILGRYLDMEPSELQFCYSSHGKPSLVRESRGDLLRFNLSHSRGLALYAIARDRELGVDLEYVRPHLADELIAEHFFSSREVTALRALPRAMQPEAFYTCWTCKEAYLKARGAGLTVPLDAFDVPWTPDELPVLLRTGGDPSEAHLWSLRRLDAGPGYVAALAVEGDRWQIQCWQWSEE